MGEGNNNNDDNNNNIRLCPKLFLDFRTRSSLSRLFFETRQLLGNLSEIFYMTECTP